MEALLQTGDSTSLKTHVCVPKEILHSPCDFTLIIANGKEFKAHGHLLSNASRFFERLLNTDMKEAKERKVRLEMITESIMINILDFIYAGKVQILTEGHAEELVAVADYLFLPRLKTFAENFLVKMLNPTNCISNYYFGEMYSCDKLPAESKKFIFENFTTVAKSEEFMSLSSEELEMWISSDDISVSNEDDVFRILCTWIDYDKVERKKHFSQLFYHVRLPYVSVDYLHRIILTNDFVKDNEDCLCRLAVTPRKSLVFPAIVVSKVGNEKDEILCYFPHEDTWATLLGNELPQFCYHLLSCHGRLYFICMREMRCYDSFSGRWLSLPVQEERKFRQIFVTSEHEMYALVSDNQRSSFATITRYNHESNSWEDISSFDVGIRHSICIVPKDNFVYFIGGRKRRKILTDAERFDLKQNKWEKIADIQEPRFGACGAAAYGKVFIAGGGDRLSKTCEVYNEETNEWQFIASLNIELPFQERIMISVDGSLYVIGGLLDKENRKIERYDPDKHEWIEKTEVPIEEMYFTKGRVPITACPMRVTASMLTSVGLGNIALARYKKLQETLLLPCYTSKNTLTRI